MYNLLEGDQVAIIKENKIIKKEIKEIKAKIQ